MQIEHKDTTNFMDYTERCLPPDYRLRYVRRGISVTTEIEKRKPQMGCLFFWLPRYEYIAWIHWGDKEKTILISDENWNKHKAALSPFIARYEELTGEEICIQVKYNQYFGCKGND